MSATANLYESIILEKTPAPG